MADNPYAPPKAAVVERPDDAPAKPSALVRFGLTTGCALVAYLMLVLSRHQGDVRNLLIGSAALSVLAGVIALAIPVRRKWLFVLPSVIASVVFAFLMGRG